MSRAARAAIAALGVATAGCAMPQSPLPTVDGTVLRLTGTSAQYRSPLPRDVKGALRPVGETHGESCRSSLAFPPQPPALFFGSEVVIGEIPWQSLTIAAGNDGYIRAVARARDAAGGAPLFDVRADVHTTSVLGIYTRDCIEVHALVGR